MVGEAEQLLSGPEAIEKVTGERPSYSNYFRWTQHGLRTRSGARIRLEFVKCGVKRKTTVEAVRRFFSALSDDAAAHGGAPVTVASSTRRDARVRRVDAELAATRFF